jgi:hypothetical protein
MKSKGRESFARCPLEAITSSPLAKRYASFGGKRLPGDLLVECAYVGGCSLLGGERRHCKAGGQQSGEDQDKSTKKVFHNRLHSPGL